MLWKQSKVIISLWLISSVSTAQYVNPNYGGVGSSGFGESGAQLSGPVAGILNPASLFLNLPRLNFSLTTGIFSDYLLFYPTIKDISLTYPILKQQMAIRLYYGIPKDNNLRSYPYRNIFSDYESSYSGGQKKLGGSIVYRMPMSKWFQKRNYFDVRLGVEFSRFWGDLFSWSIKKDIDQFWIQRYGYSGSGYGFRAGSLIKLRYTPRYYFLLSSVLQGSVFDGFSKRRIDFYNVGMGVKYFLSKESSKNIHIGFEVENPIGLKNAKVAFGLQYNFTKEYLNSIQGGIFVYPKNIYNTNTDYDISSLYWYTLGFTKTIRDWIFSCSLSDAINLDLSSQNPSNSDIVKIFSFSLSIPLSNRIAPHIRRSINATPEFIDLSLTNRKLLIGQEDTLSFYLQHIGKDSITNPRIFFNIEPKTGIILQNSFIEMPGLANMDFKQINLPLRSIPGVPSDVYTVTARLTYGYDNTVVKQFEIESTEPILEVSTSFRKNKRFWFFETPGSYILELNIDNYGTHTSDSLLIILPDEYVQLGLVEKQEYLVSQIKPDSRKKIRIAFNTSRDNLPIIMPITIIFRENNGFDPFPIHADFIMWSNTQMSLFEMKIDPFLDKFEQYGKFYAVLNLDWEGLLQLRKESTFVTKDDPNFPGKVVIGPYENLYDILAIRYTLDMITRDYELVALEKHVMIPLKRYFYLVENTPENIQILDELERLPYYRDVQQSSKLLIGPFINIKIVENIEALIQEFFSKYKVVTRYTNQVLLERKSRELINNIPDERTLNE